MNANATACSVCNAPLPFHRALHNKLCGAPACQWTRDRLPKSHFCACCERLLSVHQLKSQLCAAPECKRIYSVERSALEHQRIARELEEEQRTYAAQNERGRSLRDASAAALGIDNPERYPLVIIYPFQVPVVALPESRRQKLRVRLTHLIETALTDWEAAPQSAEVVEETQRDAGILNQVCARCQGHCCRNGGDEAYLKEENFRRYADAHPGAQPVDVLAAYMDRVGETTYEGSCIFHGPVGCTLTREMRSDICNEFFCTELREFQREHGTSPQRGFYATRGYNDMVDDGAFIHAPVAEG